MATQESHGAGVLNTYNVTWTFNSALQLTGLGANTPTAISQSFTYKNSGLLDVATDGAYSGTYSYVPNSKLVSQIVFKNSTTTRLTTTKTLDYLNRLVETKSAPTGSGELPSIYHYGYNDANQRITCALGDGSYWVYRYDGLGQVVSGKRFWGDGTPVAGQQFEYGFDDIGNRKSAKFGGDSNGQNLQAATYTTNILNQITQRSVPGVAPALGVANSAATVTVNSASPYRKGEYFWKEVTVANSAASVWQAMTVQAVNGVNTTTVTGNEYIPKTPELFSYDLDGNLTQDGRWTYSWDAENRLVSMVAVTAVGPQQKLVFTYDSTGRRIRKQVWNNTAGTGTATTDIKFIYEGWNLVAEMDALSSNANLRSYLWGTDISGSRQGAGGVGGLLAEKNSSGVAHFVVYDGNGNVTRFVDGSTGTTSATYEHGPFGEGIRVNGTYAGANPICFSTKYRDSETDLLYYGHRYYNPGSGRWASRDPINERGGVNLYGFVGNAPIRRFDALGLLFDDVQDGFMDIFLKYLLGTGGNPNNFDGYSDQIWTGIMNQEKVLAYIASLEPMAKRYNKCCSSKKFTVPGREIVHRESFYGVKEGQIDAGLAIGTGTLTAGPGLMTVKCNDSSCTWKFEVTMTMHDKYSFASYDDDWHKLSRLTWDNNWLLRIIFQLDLLGKEFDIHDARKKDFSGGFPCQK